MSFDRRGTLDPAEAHWLAECDQTDLHHGSGLNQTARGVAQQLPSQKNTPSESMHPRQLRKTFVIQVLHAALLRHEHDVPSSGSDFIQASAVVREHGQD